jgi:hypothetical protein
MCESTVEYSNYSYPVPVYVSSYPVYVSSYPDVKDSTKQAFEIIKVLQDKKLLKLDKVSDFIEVMDAIIEKLNH